MKTQAYLNDEAKWYGEISFNEKKVDCKRENYYILLDFFVIPIALLIAVSIYCFLIKDWSK